MSKKTELMGNMAVGRMVFTGQIVMTWSEMEELDTLDRRRDNHRYCSSSGFDRHDDRFHYHPYRRSDKGYFTDDFKKENPPTFGHGEATWEMTDQMWDMHPSFFAG